MQRRCFLKHPKIVMKTKMKIFFACVWGVSASFAASDGWTLSECIERVKTSSLKVESAKLDERQSVVSLDQARDSRYPSVSASISQSLFDSPFNDVPQDHYKLNLGITGSMNLWNGGATRLSIESKELSRQAARYNTDLVTMAVKESVMNAYIALLAAMEQKTADSASLILSQAVLEYNTHLFEAGSITKRDFVLAQSDVATSRGALLSAEQTEKRAATTLRQLLEFPRDDFFSVNAPQMDYQSPEDMGPLPDYESVLKMARVSNPGLLADSLSSLAAQKDVKLAGKNNSVSVDLGANATTGLQSWESDAYGNQMKVGYTHSGTLGISIPIVDAGETKAKILTAQVASEQSEVAKKETNKELENNIEQLYLQAVSADAQWEASKLQVEAEEESFRVAEEQRTAGALGYTDYLEQKNNLETARTNLTQAKYTSILARHLLDLYTGKY